MMVGSCWTLVSTTIEMNQRPAASCETVTVEGFAPSGNGRDHTIASGPATFASLTSPARQRNADRVYSAD